MPANYHSGEIAIQKQVGTYFGTNSDIGADIPRAFAKFMKMQILAVMASIDAQGRVWASALTGEPGFIQPIDQHTVQVNAQPITGDPIMANISATHRVGLLVIDLATRARIRVNGRAELQSNGIQIQTEEVFGNCQQYIQSRIPLSGLGERSRPQTPQLGKALTQAQRHWIESADTFFVASANPAGGADSSHRGGQPGFVRVRGNVLTWPDYAGNGMFQTLGNVTLNPKVGLLFINFESGSVLQLTGQATIVWDESRAAEFLRAERLIEYEIEQIIEIAAALPIRFEFQSYSPHNPR